MFKTSSKVLPKILAVCVNAISLSFKDNFLVLLTAFSISAVSLIIYPILENSKNLLLIETAKRGSHYADEISRLNARALERKQLDSLNTKFLDLSVHHFMLLYVH